MGAASDDRPAGLAGPLVAALFAGALTWLCWRFFVATEPGQSLDELAFAGSALAGWTVDRNASTLLNLVTLPAVAASVLIVLGVAMLRRQTFLGIVAAGVVVGANVSGQILKQFVLERPNLIGNWPGSSVANSLPSGHTVVAGAFFLALLLVVPDRIRPVTALFGALGVTAFGYSTLTNHVHRPSDVAAAVLLSATWAFVGVATLRAAARLGRWSVAPGRMGAFFVFLLLLAIIALGGAATGWAWLWQVSPFQASRSQQFVAYGSGIALLLATTTGGFGMLLAMLQAFPSAGRPEVAGRARAGGNGRPRSRETRTASRKPRRR